jgi:hypothetical protein
VPIITISNYTQNVKVVKETTTTVIFSANQTYQALTVNWMTDVIGTTDSKECEYTLEVRYVPMVVPKRVRSPQS